MSTRRVQPKAALFGAAASLTTALAVADVFERDWLGLVSPIITTVIFAQRAVEAQRNPTPLHMLERWRERKRLRQWWIVRELMAARSRD